MTVFTISAARLEDEIARAQAASDLALTALLTALRPLTRYEFRRPTRRDRALTLNEAMR